jgi:uncharacterized delta-60 repeat protein
VIRLATLIALAVVILAAAGVASGAARPGSIESQITQIAPGVDVQTLGVTPDGRILVAGRSRYSGFTFIRAYRPDGAPDSGFGTGGEVNLGGGYDNIAALVVEPDGQILITAPATLRRLNPDGGVDSSFGDGGSVDVDFGPGYVFLLDVALAPDGRFVAAGVPQNSPTVHVRRYLPNGEPDPSFGGNGHVTVAPRDPPFSSSVALQPDGQIVLGITGGSSGLRIGRLSVHGTLDSSFGNGGVAALGLGRRRWLDQVQPPLGYALGPLIVSGGRIRIPVSFGPRERVSRVGLVGLTANGHVDRRFGQLGLALAPRQRFAEGGEWPRTAILDGHGGILVAGSIGHGDDLSGDDSSIVRRFRQDGTVDRSFGRRGLVRDTFGTGGQNFEQELAMLDGDTAVLAEEMVTYKYQSWHGGVVHTIAAGYDRDDPRMSIGVGCRAVDVWITDASGLDRVVVRADRRVVRRTTRKRFQTRIPERTRRVSVLATDLAGNSSTRTVGVPRC